MKDTDRASFDSKLKSAAYPDDIYFTNKKAVALKDSILHKLQAKAK